MTLHPLLSKDKSDSYGVSHPPDLYKHAALHTLPFTAFTLLTLLFIPCAMAAHMPRHPRGPRPLPRTSPLPTSGSGFRHRGRAIEDVDIIWDLDLYLGREMELSFSAWFRYVRLTFSAIIIDAR